MKLRTRILRDAQDLIQSPDRWRQGGMETRKVDGTTRRCMTGAICHAAGASEVEIGSNPIIDEAIQIVSFTIQNRPDAPLPLEHVRVATGGFAYNNHFYLGYRLSMFALQPRNSFNLCLSLRRASVLISSSMSGVVKTA